MASYPDNPPDAVNWDRPDCCPFCGTPLADGGPGFIDHLEDAPTCRGRFETWRERIKEDIGGEWVG